MHDQNDPLAKLFDITPLENQRELLANTIFPFARIDGETLEVRFTEEGEQLTVREKLLLFLLTRKVLVIGNKITQEEVSPSDIEKSTGIPGGTIRPVLRKLLDERLVRDENGYIVPNTRIKDINKILAKKGAK